MATQRHFLHCCQIIKNPNETFIYKLKDIDLREKLQIVPKTFLYLDVDYSAIFIKLKLILDIQRLNFNDYMVRQIHLT